jgi:hypothetical protein
MVIAWATDLSAIDGDNTSIAVTVRAKVTGIGGIYDRAGRPDVMTESTAHVAWRADTASQLAARDRTAASVDGLALTTIDPSDPAASRVTIATRLNAAAVLQSTPGQYVASGTVRVLIADMAQSKLPIEPPRWIDAYYVRPSVNSSFTAVGDIQSALLAELAELTAYISFR